MFRYFSCNRQSVVLLALAFLLIQIYVLHASTHHVFHSSMPMCPVCVAIKGYQGSIVDNAHSLFIAVDYVLVGQVALPQLSQFVAIHYQSRAPPVSHL